ncbi:MAG TPA: aldehyde dehydrogenase family protein, partial [Holophagaceae bacterium]|nr:aldehyde dehydrogenase family protein [Holophagaceae bacterium]
MSLQDRLNFVNGAFLSAQDGAWLEDLAPATGQVIARIPRSSKADVDAAVAAAKAALPGWARTPVSERAALLDRVADLLEARLDEAAELESRDTGKPLALAKSLDIPRAVANFRFFADLVRTKTDDASMMADALNYTHRSPAGVCALVTPWNLPLYLLSWKTAPALAMGNTIVAKPSELTPLTATLLAELLQAAGCPPGVFNLIQGLGAEAGDALVSHPEVSLVS